MSGKDFVTHQELKNALAKGHEPPTECTAFFNRVNDHELDIQTLRELLPSVRLEAAREVVLLDRLDALESGKASNGAVNRLHVLISNVETDLGNRVKENRGRLDAFYTDDLQKRVDANEKLIRELLEVLNNHAQAIDSLADTMTIHALKHDVTKVKTSPLEGEGQDLPPGPGADTRQVNVTTYPESEHDDKDGAAARRAAARKQTSEQPGGGEGPRPPDAPDPEKAA